MAREAQFRPMQHWPLTVDKFIDHAARWHGQTEIVSRGNDGMVSRTCWADLRLKAKRISNALLAEGIQPGDRVGTLSMNSADHLAAWFGIMGIGAVCHTLNPRLAAEQLEYIVRHAGDQIIFADAEFAPLISAAAAPNPAVRRIIWLDGDGPEGLGAFISPHGEDCAWGEFHEDSPAGLCYTSGTTGNPKGVMYTHRSNYLHTLMAMQPDALDLSARDVWLPVVPMFHANAWGLTFAAAAVGAKLVLPGRHVDGESLYNLMEAEGVTVTAGVPTVWQSLLNHMDARGVNLDKLTRALVGGAACSQALYLAFEKRNILVQHNWGMTETSPLGTACTLTTNVAALPAEAQLRQRLKQGRVAIGVDMRIVNERGEAMPHDGRSPGFLQVRGHSIVDTYFGAGRSALDADGFFDTGDVATIDAMGYMQITDRAKDVIKSGGEWISSVDMENAVLMHPAAEAAAVIAIPHPKWDERPLLMVKAKPGCLISEEDVRQHLARQFAKWELPDIILFVSTVPLGATGKIDKKLLRDRYATGGVHALMEL
ncbi:long-chain fatty acid--CoA ligase [Sphingobium amiense]|uniref:Long-chain fatty acid--CoA ligase n=2 Tax=Sphingobium amiense TaxID=135719 RepID=A0A494WE40_9SPHN|nr:long-chain fatty acid--CoA ligase [Sphingobium amiense]BBD99180.1 long-chain fatty acid--CoA ligase [Sphingobium amiense]